VYISPNININHERKLNLVQSPLSLATTIQTQVKTPSTVTKATEKQLERSKGITETLVKDMTGAISSGSKQY
jgi:hypothetical protein